MPLHFPRLAAFALGLFLGTPCLAQQPMPVTSSPEERPDIDLYALMSGTCRTAKVDGREFSCKTVAFFHSEKGRAHFTVALDDPADESHIIAFSGINGRRSIQNVYELPIDRMLLNSKHRPKVDGIPVPVTKSSAGMCRQVGNFAMLKVTSVTCSAKDDSGRAYELQFVSDGTPITLRRVRQTMTNAEHNPYE
ncbi:MULTISPECIES: hypothetical protein [unclassified Bradyrhizobium]|uniref:hypothetical protein n=1 Tax=unclassified Bradyrhizobium TaxID=2631580 RepID=UPI0028E8FD34|nr:MULTISPECIES: hypothetical protein [unclassified Bradyrhizobium]